MFTTVCTETMNITIIIPKQKGIEIEKGLESAIEEMKNKIKNSKSPEESKTLYTETIDKLEHILVTTEDRGMRKACPVFAEAEKYLSSLKISLDQVIINTTNNIVTHTRNDYASSSVQA